jgi:RNA polymerase sigma-70 factor (ECF subfamily)
MEDVSLEIAWSAHRRRLLDIAYRMLGSLSDAEDVVQEAYARLARADRGAIDDLRSWLITVTGRLCLDHLRSADVMRRAYVGPWLPEPLVDFPGADADPADRVTLDDSLRMALLVLLEQLSPAERTAFVLHDIFQVPFDEVGAIVGRSLLLAASSPPEPASTCSPRQERPDFTSTQPSNDESPNASPPRATRVTWRPS